MREKFTGKKIIVTGTWDGVPIWRPQTAQDQMLEVINQVEEGRLREKEELKQRVYDKFTKENGTPGGGTSRTKGKSNQS